jgi:GNAT superfamily N-acetyltransferase
MGMVARQGDAWETAMLVEDRYQGQGHGTELLRALATEAARSAVPELTLLTRRDDTAVLATVHRAGLRAHLTSSDGVNRLRLPLGALIEELRASGRPPRRWPTQPLVALLHDRSELREIYAPAAVIDSAIRDGV